jgi:hypothetical protein
MVTSANLLLDKRLILVDEAYTWSLQHLRACNEAFHRTAREDTGGGALSDMSVLFGTVRVAFFGDPLQHSPPGKGNWPLFRFADTEDTTQEAAVAAALTEDKEGLGTRAAALEGRKLYHQATEFVFALNRQHRLDSTQKGGKELYDRSRLFMRDDDLNPVVRDDIQKFCKAVNERALGSGTPGVGDSLAALIEEGKTPHVAILRHKVRQELNLHIVKVHCGPSSIMPASHYETATIGRNGDAKLRLKYSLLACPRRSRGNLERDSTSGRRRTTI